VVEGVRGRERAEGFALGGGGDGARTGGGLVGYWGEGNRTGEMCESYVRSNGSYAVGNWDGGHKCPFGEFLRLAPKMVRGMDCELENADGKP